MNECIVLNLFWFIDLWTIWRFDETYGNFPRKNKCYMYIIWYLHSEVNIFLEIHPGTLSLPRSSQLIISGPEKGVKCKTNFTIVGLMRFLLHEVFVVVVVHFAIMPLILSFRKVEIMFLRNLCSFFPVPPLPTHPKSSFPFLSSLLKAFLLTFINLKEEMTARS